MKLRKIIFSWFLMLVINTCYSQPIKNQFFPLHNIIRGDSIYNTFDKQVALIKATGYDALEINQVDSFEEMKKALDKHQFAGSYFYVKINLDVPYIDNRLETYIQQLKGSKTIIAPFILSNKQFKPNTHDADTLVIRLVKQVSDWAQKAGLQVAIYPHYSFYVERTDHALALVKLINKKNVGLTFNLCHWLATTNTSERANLKHHLKELKPYLKMITVSGANNVMTQQKVVWDDYILPLGSGSFDTYGLLAYCIKDLKLKVPIGVQCYNIKGNKELLVKNTMAVWQAYKHDLTSKIK